MKTFKDLEFKKHPVSAFSTQAEMQFNNGYGISVITGKVAYGTIDSPYEIAILYNNKITYNTDITDYVIGYLKPEQVTEYMAQIQNL